MTSASLPPHFDKIRSYGAGIFGPIEDEMSVPLKVQGRLPEDLAGAYVRNGPNPRYTPIGRYHWFDGDGMVHGVYFDHGRARYTNRYVRTKGLAAEEAEGHAIWPGILEPVRRDLPMGPLKNTSNTDLIAHAGKLLSLWWLGGEPYALSPRDLSTEGVCTFDGTLQIGCASHPKRDAHTGELMFFDYSAVRPILKYGVCGPDGRVTHTTSIDIPAARLLHDIAITEKYTIFLDLPLLWRSDKLQTGKRYVAFDKALPARFGILPRHGQGNEIRWFEDSACYIFHTVNAYDDGDEVVLYACRIEDPLSRSRDAEGREKTPPPDVPRLDFMDLVPFMHEWRFNLVTGTVKSRQLDEVPTEFPKTAAHAMGRKFRYSVGPRLARTPTLLFDGFLKYDLQQGSSAFMPLPEGCFGSEAQIIPRPGATEEDDGWLVTFVYDANKDTSEVLVIDAKTMDKEPVARLALPRRLPIGFHSTWIDAADALGTEKS